MRRGRAAGQCCVIHGKGEMEIASCSGRCCVDTAARLATVGLNFHLPSMQHPEALAERRAHLGCQAEAGGYGRGESGTCAGWRRTGASGEGWTGWEAPVRALEQNLSSQPAKEVVDQD